MKKIILLLFILSFSSIYARNTQNKKLKYIIAPIFPYPAWQIDQKANKYIIKNYYKFHSFADFFIESAQNGHSGYDLSLSLYKKFLGTMIRYNITNNIEYKNRTLDIGLVYRFKPKRHIRPYFAIKYKYLNFDTIGKGSGAVFSLIYYDIMFNNKWGVNVKSFAGAVNYRLYLDFNSFLLYKIYPSVSFKVGGAYTYALHINMYAIKLGFTLRL